MSLPPCPEVGALYRGAGRCLFRVWAPSHERVVLRLFGSKESLVPMERTAHGYHEVSLERVQPGALYTFRLGDHERPDPASRRQPQGVHGPSAVVDMSFAWRDAAWRGPLLERCVFYEVHVGAFSEEGTFDGIVRGLDALKDLGVTVIQLMPVAQFPGTRNCGYDGVYPYAVQEGYGGPAGLLRLVDACHERGLAVALDVVYNHLGPEGNYHGDFGPDFTSRYRTPWGPGMNFDGPDCDPVRWHFIHNAISWVRDYHIDVLRLDAVHAIADQSAYPFLHELTDVVHAGAARLGRRVLVVPESASNDPRVVESPELGGVGADAQWSDDFHHALHTLLTGEKNGYYADFQGVPDLAKAFREGFVNADRHSPFFRRRYGRSSRRVPAQRFVVFSQNHDQVGNRMLGERLSALVDFESLKLAAGAVLLSPFLPLLFMGEEDGETAPFQYFVSPSDPALVEAVRRGRKEEFQGFSWREEPPDPQDEATFLRSKLCRPTTKEAHALRDFYRETLRLRASLPALACLSKDYMDVRVDGQACTLLVHRWAHGQAAALLLNFGRVAASMRLPGGPGGWTKRLDSAEARWLGPGARTQAEPWAAARSCALYVKDGPL